ncbi:MAG TPA: transposase [Sphingomicrobium sp.]|nr:transposase [Sphingomicrobium sp.]
MTKSPSASPDFSVREFFVRFPDERACLELIMRVRFGGTKLDCPSCGAEAQFHKLRDRRVYARYLCKGVTFHTNTVEGFWRLFKASVRSTHVHVSPKHMQSYLDEFTFRANHRERVNGMFDLLLGAL